MSVFGLQLVLVFLVSVFGIFGFSWFQLLVYLVSVLAICCIHYFVILVSHFNENQGEESTKG